MYFRYDLTDHPVSSKRCVQKITRIFKYCELYRLTLEKSFFYGFVNLSLKYQYFDYHMSLSVVKKVVRV